MSIARNHHYVPQMYLENFTTAGGDICVVDCEERIPYSVKPKKAARIHDFYQVNLRGNPMAAESALSGIEGNATQVLKAMIRTGGVPTGIDRGYLIDFISVLATRVPAIRRGIANALEHVQAELTKAVETSKGVFESKRRELVNGGFELADVTWQEARLWVSERKNGFPGQASEKTWLVKQVFVQADRLRPILDGKAWCVHRARARNSGFVAGDRPVLLQDANSGEVRYDGFANAGTRVVLPLSSGAVLVGYSGEEVVSRFFSPSDVATVNALTLATADRYLYSTTRRFTFKTSAGIEWSDALLRS